MSYGEKYKFAFTSANVEQELTIEEKGFGGSVTSLEGLLQSIRLSRQGDELLEAPIVKSNLTFTLVDRDGGMWEEFFTPDSTQYRVTLKDASGTRWQGYVTPDSYEEDLTYRGSISVTARDMLGHLADIPFDASVFTFRGVYASVSDIIRKGLELAECPMEFGMTGTGDNALITSNNIACGSWLVDTRACKDKDYYKVIEGLLDSLGLVMRWEDGGFISVCSIRDLPNGGREYADGSLEYDVQFWGLSGHRTLEPAYRMIDEELTYDVFDGDESEWNADAFSGDVLTGANGWTQQDTGKKIFALMDDNGTPYWAEDVNAEDADKYVLLYAMSNSNQVGGTTASKRYDLPPSMKFTLSFELAHIYDNGKALMWALYDNKLPSGELDYSVKWVTSSGTHYLRNDNGWTQAGVQNILTLKVPYDTDGSNSYGLCADTEISVERTIFTPAKPGYLEVTFGAFRHTLHNGITGAANTSSCWVRLGKVLVDIDLADVPKKLNVKTTYSLSQNYTLKRQPMFGKCPSKIANAGVVLNGFYLPTSGYPSVQDATIGNGDEYPLPVVVDLEILARHTSTTSLLSGTIAPADGSQINMSGIWWWGGKLFILQGGSLDPIRNCIEGAILREFLTNEGFELDNYVIK